MHVLVDQLKKDSLDFRRGHEANFPAGSKKYKWLIQFVDRRRDKMTDLQIKMKRGKKYTEKERQKAFPCFQLQHDPLKDCGVGNCTNIGTISGLAYHRKEKHDVDPQDILKKELSPEASSAFFHKSNGLASANWTIR